MWEDSAESSLRKLMLEFSKEEYDMSRSLLRREGFLGWGVGIRTQREAMEQKALAVL